MNYPATAPQSIAPTPVPFDKLPNSGSMFANGLCTIRSEARLVKPRKHNPPAITPDNEKRWLRLSDILLCRGNHHAALMLGQLRFYFETAHKAHKVLKKGSELCVPISLTDWQDVLLFSYEQARAAMRILKSEELVVSRTYMYKGSMTSHLHLTPKALGTCVIPQVVSDDDQEGGSPVESNTPPVFKHTPPVENHMTIKKEVLEKKEVKSKATSVTQNPVTTITPEIFPQETGKDQTKATPEATPKAAPVESVETKPKKATTPDAVGKVPPPKLESGKQPSKWIVQFRAAFEDQYPGVPFVLPKQTVCRNFAEAMNKRVYPACGDQTPVIAFLITKWSGLSNVLGLNVYPCMSQIVDHLEVLLQKYAEHLKGTQKATESKAKPAHVPAPAAAPATVFKAAAPQHVKTDSNMQNEYLAMLASIKKGQPVVPAAPAVPASHDGLPSQAQMEAIPAAWISVTLPELVAIAGVWADQRAAEQAEKEVAKIAA